MKSYEIKMNVKNKPSRYVAFGKNKRQAFDSVVDGFKLNLRDIADIYIGVIN